jgi:Gpi18-like mannosyltransferase
LENRSPLTPPTTQSASRLSTPRRASLHTALGQRYGLSLAVVLMLGLLVRVPVIAIDFNTTADVRLYIGWTRTLQVRGLVGAYDGTGINYPPLLLYALGGAGWLEAQLTQPIATDARTGLLIALIKLPAALADLATAGMIAWALRPRSPPLALLAATTYVFHPAVWYVSAHWGQTDSVYAFFLVAAIVALERGLTLPAWLAYTLALATKPQSIALASLLLAWTGVKHGGRKLAAGMALAVVVAAGLLMPWLLAGNAGDVLQISAMPPGRLSLVDVTAYNLWYLLQQGQVQGVASALRPLAWLPLSYQQIGFGLFGALALLVVLLALRRDGSLAVAAATLTLGLFMLATHMRERYMFPALALLLLGAAERAGGPRPTAGAASSALWWAFGALSLTFLFNLVTIAPFTPALGTNLVAAPADALITVTLKRLALIAAGINLTVLIWLVADLAMLGDNGKAR